MAFGVANQSLPGRGPTPGLRFALYAILSVTLMFLDRREGWMEQVRAGLQTAAYPLQLAVSSPSAAFGWLRESVRTRDSLRAENNELRTRLRDLQLRSMRYEALARENAGLRGLQAALPPVAEKWLVAEVVHVELNSLRPRVLINRGSNNGITKAQAVLGEHGVLGQTTHVGLWSAEVILITDPEHAIPVEIERTGLRTIAIGTGTDRELELPYLAGNADVQVDDLLITSGIGGVFPQGYPVARVTRVPTQPLEHVRAAPLAKINRDREVMLVWFREGHPAAPVQNAQADLPKGDPKIQPQPVPPKPAPETPTNPPATGTPTAPSKPPAANAGTPASRPAGNTGTSANPPAANQAANSSPANSSPATGTSTPPASRAPATNANAASANPPAASNTPRPAATQPAGAGPSSADRATPSSNDGTDRSTGEAAQ